MKVMQVMLEYLPKRLKVYLTSWDEALPYLITSIMSLSIEVLLFVRYATQILMQHMEKKTFTRTKIYILCFHHRLCGWSHCDIAHWFLDGRFGALSLALWLSPSFFLKPKVTVVNLGFTLCILTLRT